uniref:Uncharacterized protein n=1 Tax=Arundo donax TaxID=35708 RepID=A0A0A9DWT1_ARUDO
MKPHPLTIDLTRFLSSDYTGAAKRAFRPSIFNPHGLPVGETVHVA